MFKQKWQWKSLTLPPHGLYSPWNSPSQNTGAVAFTFSRGSSQPRDRTQVSCIAGRFFTTWVTRETQECLNYRTIVLISHASKVMLKILQARLQQYMNWELLDVQAGFRKGRGIRDQTANIHWNTEKAREFQKNIYFCFTDYTKAFDCVDHKLWKILKEMGVPDHLTCLLRNLYVGKEVIVRTGHRTMDWFKLGKEYVKTVCCHPAYLTYRQRISHEMRGWMNHKLESRLPEVISATSDMQMIPFNSRKWRRTKELLDEDEREEWKSWLKI